MGDIEVAMAPTDGAAFMVAGKGSVFGSMT